MEKEIKEQNTPATYKRYKDDSIEIVCSMCGKWTMYEADSNSVTYAIQDLERTKAWKCTSCFNGKNERVEMENAGIEGWAIGQSLNMAQAELLAKGLTSEDKNYWLELKGLQKEYLQKAILK